MTYKYVNNDGNTYEIQAKTKAEADAELLRRLDWAIEDEDEDEDRDDISDSEMMEMIH